MKKRRILRSERGFTLVELGIVMAIIAILAAVAYPTYTGMKTRAYIAEAKAALQEYRVEVYAIYVEKGEWPAADDVEFRNLLDEGGGVVWKIDGEEVDGKYELTAEGYGKIITLTLETTGTAKFTEGNITE